MGGVAVRGTGADPVLKPAQLARSRQMAYRLFASLFLYPEAERLALWRAVGQELLQEEEIWGRFAFYQPWRRLLERLASLEQNEATVLAGQYMELFQVNPLAPPYESVYLDPQGMAGGLVSAQVSSEYARAGLSAANSTRELPDFVATELEFMACLCDQEALAWDGWPRADGKAALQRQQEFLNKHLVRWFPFFARNVARLSAGTLYGLTAEVARLFIGHDHDLLLVLSRQLQRVTAPNRSPRSKE